MKKIIDKWIVIHSENQLIFSGYIDSSQVYTGYAVEQFDSEQLMTDYIIAANFEQSV